MNGILSIRLSGMPSTSFTQPASFLNVGGSVFDGRALVLVEPDDSARAILALEKAGMRAFTDQP